MQGTEMQGTVKCKAVQCDAFKCMGKQQCDGPEGLCKLIRTEMQETANARHCELQGTECKAIQCNLFNHVWVTSSMMDQKAADACLTFHTAHMSLNHNVRKVSRFCDGGMAMTITLRIVSF